MSLNPLNPESLGRGLALTGGGVRGLFTVSVLGEFERQINRQLVDCFDVVAGTSVGGIIAIALVSGISCADATETLRTNAQKIFGAPASLNPWGLRTERHDPKILASVIRELLGDKADQLIGDVGKGIVISSVDARSNEIVLFSNVANIGSQECRNETLLDVALATSAAPTYFPPHHIRSDVYLDGGVVSNSPDLEALRYLQAVLSRPIESAQILSVGTGQSQYDRSFPEDVPIGSMSWMKRYRLIDRIMTLQEAKATGLVAQILGSRYLRVDTQFETKVELDEIKREVLEMLMERGRFEAKNKWSDAPSRIASFFR